MQERRNRRIAELAVENLKLNPASFINLHLNFIGEEGGRRIGSRTPGTYNGPGYNAVR